MLSKIILFLRGFSQSSVNSLVTDTGCLAPLASRWKWNKIFFFPSFFSYHARYLHFVLPLKGSCTLWLLTASVSVEAGSCRLEEGKTVRLENTPQALCHYWDVFRNPFTFRVPSESLPSLVRLRSGNSLLISSHRLQYSVDSYHPQSYYIPLRLAQLEVCYLFSQGPWADKDTTEFLGWTFRNY